MTNRFSLLDTDPQSMARRLMDLTQRLERVERQGLGGVTPPSTSGLVTPGSDGWASAVRLTDKSTSNNVTLTPDEYLILNTRPRASYAFRMMLEYDSGTTPDFVMQFSGPTGATSFGVIINQAAAPQILFGDILGGLFSAGLGVGSHATVSFVGRLTTGNEGGPLQLYWCQNTSNAGLTTVYTDSYIMLKQLR